MTATVSAGNGELQNILLRFDWRFRWKIYAQAERNKRIGIIPNKMQLEFQQRYMYGGSYRDETWGEYCGRKGIEL